MLAQRRSALERTQTLHERDPSYQRSFEEARVRRVASTEASVPRRYCQSAGLTVSWWIVICLAIVFAAGVTYVAASIFSSYFTPVYFLAGLAIPYFWIEGRIIARAAEFSADYPAVLLATASSIKAGMTAHSALQRSVILLAKESMVRGEVEALLKALARGVPKEQALRDFGRDIRQPDLVLFRAAFSLALEHGGRFAPTLERLARVCNDRATMIRTARVSTATMRMTANVLLVIFPLVVLMVAVRTEDYWEIFLHHPVANVMATVGSSLIFFSYFVLRRLSCFKP